MALDGVLRRFHTQASVQIIDVDDLRLTGTGSAACRSDGNSRWREFHEMFSRRLTVQKKSIFEVDGLVHIVGHSLFLKWEHRVDLRSWLKSNRAVNFKALHLHNNGKANGGHRVHHRAKNIENRSLLTRSRALLDHALQLRGVDRDTLGIVEHEEHLLEIGRRRLPKVFRQRGKNGLRRCLFREASTRGEPTCRHSFRESAGKTLTVHC